MVIGRNPADIPYLESTLLLRLDMWPFNLVPGQLGYLSHLANDLGWTPNVFVLEEVNRVPN